MLYRLLLSCCAPPGRSGRLSILIFHRVLSQPDPLFPLEPDVRQFDKIVSWMKRWFQILPLGTAVRQLKTGNLPARAACITFDDGYADNFHNAMPILCKHDAPATFFIASGFLNGGRMWNDTVIEAIRSSRKVSMDLDDFGHGLVPIDSIESKRIAIERILSSLKHLPLTDRSRRAADVAERCAHGLPDDLMLTSEQVRRLRHAGMEIGSHTVNHPILKVCDDSTARLEIMNGRRDLEDILGDPVTLFAYPNGRIGYDYTESHARMVESLGFEAAVSTNIGASQFGDDIFQLRRFTPWDRKRWQFGLRMALNLTSRYRT